MHILIGLTILILEFLMIPLEEWILSPGLVIPMFIIITGAFCSLITSAESGRLIFSNIIKPRLDTVTEEQETAYFDFRKTNKILFLVQAYLAAILLIWLWVTLNTLGADPIWGLLWLVPCFVIYLSAAGSISAFILKHTRYKILIPLLKVEVDWIWERRRRNRERKLMGHP